MPVPSPLLKGSGGLAQPDPVTYGDVDGSGTVTATDALLAQKAFLGQVELDERQKKAADVNGDGMVNATDALLIKKYALGEIDQFPVEKEERAPQRVRTLRNDIASLKTEIAMLQPFEELPPWRRKRLVKATNLSDEADILVEDPDNFTAAKTKYDEALRLYKDDQPPPNGGNGSNGNGSNGNGSNGNGSGENGSGENGSENGGSQRLPMEPSPRRQGESGGEMFAGVNDTALVLGAGVAATGIIALIASG